MINMEKIAEKALARLDKRCRTVLFDANGQSKSYENANCEVLIDLINHRQKDYCTMVTDHCGKATAVLLEKAAIRSVYALKISEKAIECLKEAGIDYFYQERVRVLMNPEENDLDEYEKSTLTQDDIYEAVNDRLAAKRTREYWAAHCGNALNYHHLIDISQGCQAVSSLYDAYSLKQLREPRKKDLSIAVDHFKMPCGLLETSEIIVAPLKNIDEELAEKEGLSLANWKQERLPLLLKEAKELGLKIDEELWIVFEIFKKIAD